MRHWLRIGKVRRLAAGLTALVLAVPVATVAVTAVETVLTRTPPAGAAVPEPYHCPPPAPWTTFYIFEKDGAIVTAPAFDDSYGDPSNDSAPGTSPYLSGPDNRTWTVPASDGVSKNDAVLATHDHVDVAMVIPPTHAKDFSLATDGSWTWTPQDGWLGGDSFTYMALVGGQCIDSAVVTIQAATRDRVLDDTYTVPNNATFRSNVSLCFTEPKLVGKSGASCGVSANDLASQAIGQPFSEVFRVGTLGVPFTTPSGGTLTLSGNGFFTYVPKLGYVGDDFFYYRVPGSIGAHDGLVSEISGNGTAVYWRDSARVTIHVVQGSVSSPVQPDFFVTDEDTPVTVTQTQLLANDALDVGPIIGLNGSSAASIRTTHGTLAVTWNQSCIPGFGCQIAGLNHATYTPDADFNGNDSFVYTGAGNGLPGVVTISVNPIYDRPQAANDFLVVPNHTSVTLDFTANDYDPDGGLLKSQLTITPTITPPGSLVDHGNGQVTFNANGNGFGGYYIEIPTIEPTYTAVETLSFFVQPNPAADDTYSTDEDTQLSVPAPGAIGNDDGNSSVAKVSDPQHGSLVFLTDGSFTYRPAPNYAGPDSFTYTNGGKTATVNLTVNPIADPPGVRLNTYCDVGPGQVCPLGDYDNRGNLIEGDSARLRGAIIDPEETPGTLSVSWGDGTTTTADYPCLPGAASCPFTTTATWSTACTFFPCVSHLFFDLRHTYANNPPNDAPKYTIRAVATSSDGLSGSANESAVVKDGPPTLSISPDCSSGVCLGSYSVLHQGIGGTVTVRGRVTDPGTDTGRLSIDWGDGSADSVPLTCGGTDVCPQATLQLSPVCLLPFMNVPSCGYFSFTHTYPDTFGSPSSYPIRVLARTGVDPSDTVSPGLTASADRTATVDVRADEAAPSAAPTLRAPAVAGAWNRADVTVDWNWSDSGGSGVDPARCTQSSGSSGEGMLTLQATCADNAGNEGTATYDVQVDKTAPVAAPAIAAANAAGWYKADVSVTWNWTDSGGSGIDPAQCTTSSFSTGEGSAVVITATCHDRAGNTGTRSVTVKVDKTDPALAPIVTPNPVLLRGAVSVDPQANDSVSGVRSSSCGTVSSATLGGWSVSCTATDRAGNTATASRTYVVGVAVLNINPTGRSKFKAGANFPVKFQLARAGKRLISSTLARQVSNNCNATVTVGSQAPLCAVYDRKANRFQVRAKLPANAVAGTSIPITVAVTVGGVLVGTGGTTIVVSR